MFWVYIINFLTINVLSVDVSKEYLPRGDYFVFEREYYKINVFVLMS